jgi:hypothetical protein
MPNPYLYNPGNEDAYACVYGCLKNVVDSVSANDLEAASQSYTQAMNAAVSFTPEDWSILFQTYPDMRVLGMTVARFMKENGRIFGKSTMPLPNPYHGMRTFRRAR